MISRLMPALSAGTMLLGGFFVLTGARSCGGVDADPAESPDAVCKTAADCEGLPHLDCDGTWSCSSGECGYACSTSPALVPTPGACHGDADCGLDQRCSTDHGCQPSACSPDGSICTTDCAGLCVDLPPDPTFTRCQADTDCGDGWCDYTECVGNACEGVCRGQTITQPDCQSDADCGDGSACVETCQDVVCFAEPCLPVCTTRCEPVGPPPPVGCQSDAECGDGARCEQVCNAVACFAEPCPPKCQGICVPPEPPPVACATSSDCGPGFECLETCTDVACFAYPCPTVCTAQCVPAAPPPPGQCATSADCAAGEECQLVCNKLACYEDPCPPPCQNFCVPAEPPPPPQCQPTGCSGEICADAPMMSPCVALPSFQCLSLTTCGAFAADGGCGWEPTPAYLECLKAFGATP